MSLRPHSFAATLPRSSVFRGTVDGLPLDILTHPAADHVSFECAGDVVVKLSVTGLSGRSVIVRPLRLGIQATVTGDHVSFTVPGPQNLQVEISGKPLLYVYALPPAPPTPVGPKVRVFEAGKIHDVGLLVLGQGETCWIEAGAVVRGSIRAERVSNVRIGGYGILDGGYWLERENRRRKALVLDHCRDASIETILMVSPCHWMVVLGACEDVAVTGVRQIANDMSSDGIDIAGSRRIRVTGCCLHNGDDNIAIKAIGNTSGEDERVPLGFPDEHWKETVEDVVVSGCIFFNTHGGSAMEIGYETSTDHIRNIRFEDIDVLAVHEFGAVFGIHNGDRAMVENVVWDNIRVEHHFDTLIDFRVLHSRWNVDAKRGGVRNITLRNIKAVQSPYNAGYTVSIISGFNAAHPVTDVTFENFEL
ncbi:MAG: glycosyl hydrolase family 28 protein, partial [Rariglobus sp.]